MSTLGKQTLKSTADSSWGVSQLLTHKLRVIDLSDQLKDAQRAAADPCIEETDTESVASNSVTSSKVHTTPCF